MQLISPSLSLAWPKKSAPNALESWYAAGTIPICVADEVIEVRNAGKIGETAL